MARKSDDKIVPRNGHTLMVMSVCRISGCANQKELSLEDQEDNAGETVSDLYEGPVERHNISTKGKGERLDRPEIEEIEAAYKSRKYDLFVYDDLSRLIRGGEAARLLGVGVDHGTRSVCIEDGIDTEDGTWEVDALNACSENVAHNERTSKRVKHKCMNRFKKTGWTTRRHIAGYIVPPGAKSYDDWRTDDTWASTIQEGFQLLRKCLDCAVVADYFKQQNFPVGPYARRKDWNGSMVRRFFANPLLKGLPQRGAKHTVKHHGSGRRTSVINPKGPHYYHAPHLAHLTEADFDSLNALLDATNEFHRRPTIDGVDPLLRRSRKDSRFPRMAARCWYCGWDYVWGGNGITDNLMCSNSREWHCWHSIGFSGPEAVEKLVAEICRQLSCLDQFDDQFAAMVTAAGSDLEGKITDDWRKLRRDEELLGKQRGNLLATIKKLGPHDFLQAEIEAMNDEKNKLLMRRHRLEHHRPDRLELPESTTALRGLLEDEFRRLAIDSPAFGKLVRRIVPEWYTYSVRLCDGGHLLPRAKIKLNLAGSFPDVNLVPGLEHLLTHKLTLDLFTPPQRERIREESIRLATTGMKPTAIARMIDERPTSTAVQNALALHRKMIALGLDSPYVVVLEPPDDYPKLRRHKHPRYTFQPRDGYERPSL